MSQKLQPAQAQTNFGQFYKEQCIKHNVKINNTIYHGMKGNDLTVNLDLLHYHDLQTFNPVLNECMFTHIKFMGNPPKKQVVRKTKPLDNNIKQKKTGFSQENKFIELVKQININIAKSTETKVLILENLKMSKHCYEILAEGLEKNKSIKELYINNCEMEHQDLEALSKGISGNEALILLDLSKNNLSNSSGRVIGKILSTHSQRRDDIVWLYSLRGEVPEEDICLKGIYEVNLSENNFDSNCIKDLCSFLQYDNWVRSLNFRKNLIEEDGVQEINNVLDNNENLISLDLRENPGFFRNYSSVIFQKLLRNIKSFKKKRQKQLQQQQKQINMNPNPEQQVDPQEQYGDFDYNQISNIQGNNNNKGQDYQDYDNNGQIYEEDEFQEPTEMEKMNYVMNNLYNDSKINQITNKNCKGCKQLEKKLIQSEYRAINLKIENFKLKNLLNKQQISNQQNSWSAIQPNNFNPIIEQTQENNNTQNNESGEMPVLNKIEGLMLELTRMMDGLEGKPNDVTNNNNFSYQMSNTLNTQNATYQLLQQNNTFSNFLGQQSNNNSNIIPQPIVQQQSQQQQQQQNLQQQQFQQQQNQQQFQHQQTASQQNLQQQQQQQQQFNENPAPQNNNISGSGGSQKRGNFSQ